MNRKIAIRLICALLLLSICMQNAGAQEVSRDPAGSPRIVVEDNSHDFGEVKQGAKVDHTFVIRNTGQAPLKIIEAKGS